MGKLKKLWIVSVASLLTGCLLSGLHPSTLPTPQELYQLPLSDNLDLTWVDSSTMILRDFGPETKIWSFNTTAKTALPLEILTDCPRPFVRSLQRLPNNEAGFILDCPKTGAQIIQQVDRKLSLSKDIYVEPSITWLGDFAFSANMQELMLVDIDGVALASNLYYQSSDGNRRNITPDFQRADYPVWSPVADKVAFLGTKQLLNDSADTKTWQDIENLFDYPWKIYIYDLQKDSIEEIAVEIIHPGRFKWSPNGRWLGFTGEYKGVPGVWIVDLGADFEVIRIVDEIAPFDFSADGKALAYIAPSSSEDDAAIFVLDLSTLVTK